MVIGILRIGMLHLAPRLGDLEYNRRLVEKTVATAAAQGAEWIVTPELGLCGYQFASCIGTDWIVPHPDPWLVRFCQVVAAAHITVFLSHPERDRHTDKLYNTVFVIGPDGTCLGTHRKVNVVPGAEAWASPGHTAVPVFVPPLRVGLLVCSDACTPGIARRLQAEGAEILISPAAWPPRPHGPEGAWEQRSRETGLPLFVCNRTGSDRTLSFLEAESVVVKAGERLLTFSAPHSTVLLVDWDPQAQELVGHVCQGIELD
jgi:5-aminopentanamidase